MSNKSSSRDITIASIYGVSIGFKGCAHPDKVDVLLPIAVVGEWDDSLKMATWWVDYDNDPHILRFSGTHYIDSVLASNIATDWIKCLVKDTLAATDVPIRDYGQLSDLVAGKLKRLAPTTARGGLWLSNQFHEVM